MRPGAGRFQRRWVLGPRMNTNEYKWETVPAAIVFSMGCWVRLVHFRWVQAQMGPRPGRMRSPARGRVPVAGPVRVQRPVLRARGSGACRENGGGLGGTGGRRARRIG